MQKNKLLTIGQLAKMSGVHIKSLRYYDSIGVLKPKYIDPYTNYRYYTHSQLGIVDAIQICVGLGIPLKQFYDFVDDGGEEIHYGRLLKYGKMLAEKKIRAMRSDIRQIDFFQREVKRSELLVYGNQPAIFELPKKRYYTILLDHTPDSEEYYENLGRLYTETAGEEYTRGSSYGLIYLYHGREVVRRFQFVEIISGGLGAQAMLTLPAGKYISKCTEPGKIETAPEEFPELFAENRDYTVLESELYTRDYNVSKSLFELRCSV